MTEDKTEFVSIIYYCYNVGRVYITSLSTTHNLCLNYMFYIISCFFSFIGLGK